MDPVSNSRLGRATLGPGQFFGELQFLAGGVSRAGARAVLDFELLCVPRQQVLRLMAENPDMSDITATCDLPSDYLLKRLQNHSRIEIQTRTQIEALHGAEKLERITISDRNAARSWDLHAEALFVMVGTAPNTGWLPGLVALDDKGFGNNRA